MLSLKGIRSALGCADFEAIAALRQLEELVLDCDQPPEPAPGDSPVPHDQSMHSRQALGRSGAL